MGTGDPYYKKLQNPHVRWAIAACMLLAALLIAIWLWKHLTHKHKPLPSNPLVVTAPAQKKEVPVYLTALGTVTPLETVTVKTQVDGQLLTVPVQEGQTVKKGNLLAQIDPRPFEAQLMQFQGDLKRDIALLENAKLDLKRYQALWKEDSISKQILDTQVSLVKQLEGTVLSDKGQVEGALVNLTFCRLTSPIDGRVGLRLVDPGNFVQTTDTTGVFVINTVQPITVVFILPEDNIPQVLQQMKTGKKLTVEAYDRSQNKLLATGWLLSIDNQIDTSTGTVKLKATFKNKDDALFPNQFVNIKLLIETLQNATVVPTTSVLRGVKGNFVYLLNEKEKTVTTKYINIANTSGNDTVVTSGVTPGEYVITEGTDKLTDGAKVDIASSAKKAG